MLDAHAVKLRYATFKELVAGHRQTHPTAAKGNDTRSCAPCQYSDERFLVLTNRALGAIASKILNARIIRQVPQNLAGIPINLGEPISPEFKIMPASILIAILSATHAMPPTIKNFADDVDFLRKHVKTHVLKSGDSVVAVVPAWQGRVATSSFSKDSPGNGWLNFSHIASGKFVPHINVFGGEDRFWLGPEGGQFSIFFPPGSPFDLEHWQTPPLIDTEPYEVTSQTPTVIVCEKSGRLKNYWGTEFTLHITRAVQVHSRTATAIALAISIPPTVRSVSYTTLNKVTNTGQAAWTKDTGLLSIWILGMFKHSSTTFVVAPYEKGDVSSRGPIVNDEYFGKVPADRLKVTDQAIVFKADGKYRSKIGLNPHRAKNVVGSYDPARNLLTIVTYNKPKGVTDYVNSMWEIQEKPYGGDVVNSYNDGPPAPGKKPLGPFYELETSSPALALKPGETASHISVTTHFTGPKNELKKIAKAVLGVDLDAAARALK